jgi:hypothetical protein
MRKSVLQPLVLSDDGLVLGGQLRSVKIGRRRLVVRASIEEYVARLEAAGR